MHKPALGLYFKRSFLTNPLFLTMILFLFTTLVVGSYMIICSGNPTDLKYVVVIDAGSTGSKATTYKFHISRKTEHFTLDDKEIFEKVTPGLDTFANNPNEEKLQLSSDVLSNTPIALAGTGGLRSLKSEQANTLLEEADKTLKKSGFSVKDDAVTILSGDDEGIFSWFTTNILLDRLGTENTVAALDLGGSSTQVTFPLKEKSNDHTLADHIFTVETSSPEDKMDLFSISYSNLGRKYFGNAVFGHGNSDEATDWYSVCIHPDSKPYKIELDTTSHNVYGIPNNLSTVDIAACMNLVEEKMSTLLTPKPTPLKNVTEIFAFSGFFKVINAAGLIDPEEGGQASLDVILSTAVKECSIANDENPILCLNLIYVYVLLHDGYELKPETRVNFHLKLKGHYISWALGFAYDQLTGIRRTKKIDNK
ncbi:ectonucleoside triphosphate diphosphohydrolase 5-like isoform X2 [Contarinia nasturtii]|uniref:ectonucleoside triphosphate diphosphohydrolase 5-like isoform X2 n=1 Tax=Contarinia nasturtii TaxID=265458 RepID=UPI0012D47794|nr:ectonucleoside triphosphate diphosphohydrolase 5-like isoform X2 [Contarinia nasturtii]